MTDTTHSSSEHGSGKMLPLALGAIGVVFGDIGTSPLYSLKESFAGPHPLAIDRPHIFGVLSLIFWTMTLVVTIKYVLVTMRADNDGEGGSLALLALIVRSGKIKWTKGIVLLGVLATALFYGDAIITPAISVLSAVEGLEIVGPSFAQWVVPISIVILIGLFLIQSYGTAKVGIIFGPVMLFYFLIIGIMGLSGILRDPSILAAINPWWALNFFLLDPKLAFLALGSVVLAVTGAEALYADMGHFGRKSISVAWLYVAFPCLLLNYLGQSALLLDDPKAIDNPFFRLAPDWAQLPLIGLATIATVIASQAVISGAYSVTQQAVQLGFLPRLRITHTSASAAGQIYVPLVNWLLLIFVLMLVLTFKSSGNLASAYGIAVTGTMVITSLMVGILVFTIWKWNKWAAGLLVGAFLIVDGAYFASNVTKIPDGGWFPLLVGACAFTVLTTWATGRRLLRERLFESAMPLELFIKTASKSVRRVPGTAVFLSASPEGAPPALLHNLKHNKVLHERIVILTVKVMGRPHVDDADRMEFTELGPDFYRIVLKYGFMQEVDVPAAMAMARECGPPFKLMETSFFLGRQTLVASDKPGMAVWREKLFAWMMRNAESAMEFFKLPSNRVVELGSQLEI
ncbi:potassium transporter Kup [Sphingomonas sp. CGMCC 1.13654]|uniref:Probable potassium transport system protein Kup n=1 Tax=Sphingomonas chungangi TaxID=2683589 RepID=A0A838L8B3_9SPHN|nr:potassium transporter Kup [Sphingomonas chungangi]MBA2934962.1 potassium transporter Kup [Sphingomonas chungangi]MVW58272.1 potassium transporter Kup [Sphingomonas chungangi]